MEWLLVLVTLLHLLLCPFTKVEESFNLQAMHDILYHQSDISMYDHFEFPGVVPRTFLGPLVVSILASPFVFVGNILGSSKLISQYLVRAVLGGLVLWPLLRLKRRIKESLGSGTAEWFLFISISQFHFNFYLSRPLPNTMALPLVLLAYEYWINQQHDKFIMVSAAAILIFRAELAILLGLILLVEILTGHLSVPKALSVAIPSGIVLLALTVLVDSYFWGRWLWPEGEVLWFNLYLNKSSDWGTSPFSWYFISAIPRAMGCSILLVPFGFLVERRIRLFTIIPLVFVLAYSFLPHKELRFIIYVFPLLNIAAAAICSRLWENRKKNKFRSLLAVGAAAHLLANLVLTCFLVAVSRTNYPGGEALALLHRLEPAFLDDAGGLNNVSLHISNLAAQTGVSRFGQLHSHWRYDKTENLKAGGPELMTFTHLIVEAKSKHAYAVRRYSHTHQVMGSVEAFSQIRSTYHHFPPIRIKTKPSLFILKNLNPPAEPDFSFINNKDRIPVQEDLEEGEELDFEFTNHFEGDVPLANLTEEAA